MKFTNIYRQSRVVAGVCIPEGDYDELLREALRVAMGITDPCAGDFDQRYARIHELVVAYIASEEGEGSDTAELMARLAVNISAVIPLTQRR